MISIAFITKYVARTTARCRCCGRDSRICKAVQVHYAACHTAMELCFRLEARVAGI